jgi:hypothetical protein
VHINYVTININYVTTNINLVTLACIIATDDENEKILRFPGMGKIIWND